MLKQDKASVVVAKLAYEYLREDDVEPPFLPKVSTIRKIKSRVNEQLIFDQDPTISLREMKYAEQYQNVIENIGMDPFECQFATVYQKEVLRLETNRARIVISLDATGAPVKKPTTSSYSIIHGRYKPIFLYVIVLHTKDGSFLPVYQVLTQRQDASNIRSFLDTWKRQCLPDKNPHEIITDNSAALLLASVQAFSHCSTMTEYDDKCYEALFQNTEPPATYNRLDRAHTVKSILRMFSNLDANKKKFYTRIFGYLLINQDIHLAENIIKKLFIVLLNRYQYDIYVTNAINYLKELTDTHRTTIADIIEDSKNKIERELLDGDAHAISHKNRSKFYLWITEILTQIKVNHVNDELNCSSIEPSPDVMENPFYAENFEKDVCALLAKIHLWSNVMITCFQSKNETPSSPSSEAEFNLVKNVIFSNEKAIEWIFLLGDILIILVVVHCMQ